MDPQAFNLLMERFDSVEQGQREIKAALSGPQGLEPRLRTLENERTLRTGVMVGGGAVVAGLSTLGAFLVTNWHKIFS